MARTGEDEFELEYRVVIRSFGTPDKVAQSCDEFLVPLLLTSLGDVEIYRGGKRLLFDHHDRAVRPLEET